MICIGRSLTVVGARFQALSEERPAKLILYFAGPLFVGIRSDSKEMMMSKETVEGAVQKGVGSVKEAAGKAGHNDKLVAEGLADRAAGTAKEAVGKTKDAVHKATK